MNILITGANGFLGTELTKYFCKNNNVIPANRSILDPRDLSSVINFFNNNKIDIIIHTAIKGGKRGQEENIDTFFDNLKMFDNLLNQSENKLLINFGSGAEFDRRTNIDSQKEEAVYKTIPEDYYGLSKNLITRKILKSKNAFNLRLFGCFGANEEPQRLFKNCLNSKVPTILEDRYMDYFYVEDVCLVVEHLINNHQTYKYRDINLCYDKKYKLSELASKILSKNNDKKEVKILKTNLDLNYTGSSERLRELNIDLHGLDNGLERYLSLIEGKDE
jgi:GDP-L-fucose synthase